MTPNGAESRCLGRLSARCSWRRPPRHRDSPHRRVVAYPVRSILLTAWGAGSLTLTYLRSGVGMRPDGGGTVRPISFKRHRFPPDVIRYAVWLYFRFTLSIREVEELLAQRGIEVSREAVRCWVIKF